MLAACLLVAGAHVRAEESAASDIEQLREAIDLLRQDYEQRIAELERRLEEAEARSTQVAAAPPAAPSAPPEVPVASRAAGGDSAFNPAIGIIFQGQAWSYGQDPEDYEIPGFPLAGEAGPVPEGLALGETEINISGAVDDWFTAWLTVPIHVEDGETHVEVEEAWIETLGLPAGLSLRMGRFFSDIGYLNTKHAHSWDFVDQPLPYQAFLGNQYIDDGVQMRWVAPTDLYFELGAEVLRGDRYPAAGAQNSGFGAWSMHARLGGDVGLSSSWLAGISWLSTESRDRVAGHEHEDEHEGEEGDEYEDEAGEEAFTGDSDLLMAEFVWKWAPNGNWKQRNFKFQAEYLWRDEKGFYELPGIGELPWDVGQEGYYLQAVYQPFPGWRFGARYDTLSGDYPGAGYDGTSLELPASDPSRYSLMADWSHSEFSRLRLQYTRDDAGTDGDKQWGLQYIYSIGAHGAHSF
jgi:hypothetical protein